MLTVDTTPSPRSSRPGTGWIMTYTARWAWVTAGLASLFRDVVEAHCLVSIR